jgi:hypothetical protein
VPQLRVTSPQARRQRVQHEGPLRVGVARGAQRKRSGIGVRPSEGPSWPAAKRGDRIPEEGANSYVPTRRRPAPAGWWRSNRHPALAGRASTCRAFGSRRGRRDEARPSIRDRLPLSFGLTGNGRARIPSVLEALRTRQGSSERDHPTTQTVRKHFGSWQAALAAARPRRRSATGRGYPEPTI